jgi:uncharacterized protein YdaU (DUF1376 family)
MNYFELYPGDYLRDTTRLTLIEHGAYLRLLMAYYAEETPFPDDDAELFVIVSAVSQADKTAVRKVADRFFPVADDGLRHNNRADEEIIKARRRIETAQANGVKGGRPRKPKRNPTRNPNGTQEKPSGLILGSENPGFSKPKQNPAKTQSGEALHTPHAIQALRNVNASTQGLEGARAGVEDVCRRMREAGCPHVDPSRPEIHAAKREGVSDDALVDTAREAVAKGKQDPFGWAIATARGRHADGAAEIHSGEANGTRGKPGGESLCERAERACRAGDERDRLAVVG